MRIMITIVTTCSFDQIFVFIVFLIDIIFRFPQCLFLVFIVLDDYLILVRNTVYGYIPIRGIRIRGRSM